MTTIDRTEAEIERLTRVADSCSRGGVDLKHVAAPVEALLTDARAIREAAEAAGLNSRERRVIADAVGQEIRRGME